MIGVVVLSSPAEIYKWIVASVSYDDRALLALSTFSALVCIPHSSLTYPIYKVISFIAIASGVIALYGAYLTFVAT